MVLTLFTICGCTDDNEAKISDTRFAMDTFIKIDAYSPDHSAVRLAEDAAFQEFQQAAIQTDRFNDGGKGSLWQLNHTAAGQNMQPARHLAALLQFYTLQNEPEVDITLGALSDLWLQGKETSTVPDENTIRDALQHCGRSKLIFNASTNTAARTDNNTIIDLGSIAKGYAVDIAAAELQKSQAVSAALINGGGNIKVLGQKPGGGPWVIAVQHPRKENSFLGTVILQPGQAAATSGDYQRYYEAEGQRWHHLLSPQTGCPSRLHQSVTVIAPSALEADYNSTLLFLKENAGIQNYLAQKPELGAIIVNADGSIWVSPNLKQFWHPAEE